MFDEIIFTSAVAKIGIKIALKKAFDWNLLQIQSKALWLEVKIGR